MRYFQAMPKLRLASYNVHKCVGSDGRRKPGRIVSALQALGADIVALQEVDRRYAPRPAALPRRLIEDEAGYVALGAPQDHEVSLGWHGNAVLLRQGMRALDVERLHLPGLEPRGALMVEAETGGAPVRIVAVHLGLLRSSRVMQLHAIRMALEARDDMPTAILGDFNEWSTRLGTEALGPHFEVHAPGRTFHALQPVGRLDRIALSPGLRLRKAGVFDTPEARRASDHLPVWAEVAPA